MASSAAVLLTFVALAAPPKQIAQLAPPIPLVIDLRGAVKEHRRMLRMAQVRHRRHERWVKKLRAHRRRLRYLRRLAERPLDALRAAQGQLGVPYVWGGETPGQGFDCSGLVQWAYARVGVYLPRTTWEQEVVGTAVSLNDVQPGDLVFAEGGGHVGLYAGGGMVINAPTTGSVVQYFPLFGWGFWESARRVLP